MPLVGQRAQRLDEQLEGLDVDRKLAGLRLHQVAARTDDVAKVPLLELAVELLAETVALDEQLNLPGPILNMNERVLTHDAFAHHAAGDANCDFLFGERF